MRFYCVMVPPLLHPREYFRLYWAVEEAAAARTAKVEAEAEAKRAFARLGDTRAECGEQHRAIAAEIEAVQGSVKESLRASCQQHTVESAKMDAMCYRLEETKDLLLQRKLRTETKMAELHAQIDTWSSMARGEKLKPDVSISDPNVVPARTPNPRLTLKTRPNTVIRIPKSSEVTTKTSRVHV